VSTKSRTASVGAMRLRRNQFGMTASFGEHRSEVNDKVHRPNGIGDLPSLDRDNSSNYVKNSSDW